MKTILSYLYLKRNIIIFFSVCVLCFAAVFYLYDLPVEAVLYSSLLCVLLGGVFAFFGGAKNKKKINEILRLKNQAIIDINNLPCPDGNLEAEYMELITELCERINNISTEYDSKVSDMTEYYTMWVHQIKTPIAAMRLLLETDEKEHNRELSGELFKIEQYVEMVIGYLKTDSESNDFVIERYNLDKLVKQAVRRFAKQFIRKKITLNYGKIDCVVLTDEKWLVFVIEQVLSNALKYTKSGSVSIYIKEGKTLVIEDTGIGIAPEDLPRVCECGYTGYNGRTDKKSTGIGLYLCKKITDKLGHSIEIFSDSGKGTKVEIHLDSIELEVE